ncbi:MAG: FecR family protein [Sphingobacterium sp.]
MDNTRTIRTLLTSYLQSSLSSAEHAALFALMDGMDDNDLQALLADTLDEMEDEENTPAFVRDRVEVLRREILDKINAEPISANPAFWTFGRTLSAIVATLAVLVSLTYIFMDQSGPTETDNNVRAQQSVLPASMKATIQIDGVAYELSGEKGGLVLSNDRVSYGDGSNLIGGMSAKTIAITTPFGGHYHLALRDGTKVWLNAGSALSYTSEFGQSERRVKLVGEGYFEVANQDDLPFIVESAGQEVQVLGTSFNINAYPNETIIKTTLSTGSLKIKTRQQNIVLQPDQQARVDAAGETIDKISVDASAFTDWKEGIINLHGVNLAECMRMIARWYDLDVIFTGDPPDIQLGGKMSTGVSLHTFLNFLKQNFQVESELIDSRTLYIGRTKQDKHDEKIR